MADGVAEGGDGGGGRVSRRAAALSKMDFETERGELPEEGEAGAERFLASLTNFLGEGNFRIPQVCGAPLDVTRLYREVCSRGGLQEMVNRKRIKEIGRAMDLHQPTASYVVRSHYERLLLRYEQTYWKGSTGSGAVTPAAAVFPSEHVEAAAEVATPAGEEGSGKRRRVLAEGLLPPPPPMTPGEKSRELEVEHIQGSMVPSIGPYLQVELPLEDNEQLLMALESREAGAMAWALNSLAAASAFTHDRPRRGSLRLVVQLLVAVVREGLQEAPPHVRSALQAEARPRAEAELRPPPSRGATQTVTLDSTPDLRIEPFWWEAEDGLLAPAPGREDAFSWALCGSHILRNLAAMHAGNPLPIWAMVDLIIDCLQYHLREFTPGSGELAANMLGVMAYVGADVSLPALDPAPAGALVAAIVECMQGPHNYIRVRIDAAMALATLADATSNQDAVARCLRADGPQVLAALVALAGLDEDEALREVASGRHVEGPGRAEGHVAELSGAHAEAVAMRLLGSAQAAGAAGLARLSAIRVSGVREAVAAAPGGVAALLALVLRRPPAMAARVAARGRAFPTLQRGYAQLAGRTEAAAALALSSLAQVEPTLEVLRGAEGTLAEAAMRAGGHKYAAPLLALING
eukprot:jgi/Tetstr1/442699/TSEL_030790.t1